ncbi:hypothetical protein HMPREF0239_03052 [Clostridium sp. ATCC BAA-442]|nr:hypothetical protein HMPREF0239_03052 [Clostridium sp. ATCC BAA-442]
MRTLPGVTYHIPSRSYVVFLVSTFACPSLHLLLYHDIVINQ